MPPPRLKPPTKTRPEIILDLKYRMMAMSKADMFNTFCEYLTSLDLQGIAAALPALAPQASAGQGTSTPVAAGTLAGATGPAAPPQPAAYACPVCSHPDKDRYLTCGRPDCPDGRDPR